MKKIVFLCLVFLKITGCASFIEEQKEKKKREKIFGLDQVVAQQSEIDKAFMLANPNIKKQCHPWKTNGNELIQAHCTWTIQGTASWKRTNNLGGVK